ncbi:hypothetical protein DAERI_010399 [Deinococcus aerius]|uniref:Uncharacterized protein n=1 Tax=Deinococcus aerius TaxID=200253 RepID=A0A2I9DPZ8_9DEIO|nr:hypothetical protein [Deinococcus aerius]GBF04227.1 hypothetical protein DAERI_010399 [Deinococcus aerius]
MTHWAELVELYEYKVADVVGGRVPRGGRRSLADLREVLHSAPLEPALYHRLLASERQYRAHLRGGSAPETPPPAVPRPPAPEGARPSWTPPVTGGAAEAQAWEELRQLAWYAGLRTRLLHLGRALQAEPERPMLRTLYAVVENAGREARGVAERLAVPAAHDPLVSLHQPEVTRDLMLTLADELLSAEGRSRLRTALSDIHEAPFPRHPDEDVLAARLEAAEREPLAPAARAALVEALRASSPQARDPRERPAIREAARRLQQGLDELLADAPGPGLGLLPTRSILYAEHAEAALPAPDDGASELVIHLAGGQAARWRGLDLRWQPVGPNWQLQVNGQLALLRPDRPPAERLLTLRAPDLTLRGALSGTHLLLRAEPRSPEALGRLAARARVVALLLDPGEHHANLRLARAAVQFLRDGAVKAGALGPGSAQRYAGAPDETLLALARKGAEGLTARLARLTPAGADAALRASAAVLGLSPERARRLHERLHAAAFIPEELPEPQPLTRVEVPGDGSFVSLALGDDPLTLRVLGRSLTLRLDHRGDLVAAWPGQARAVLGDLLVLRRPEGQILLVRQGTWLGVAAGPADQGKEAPGNAQPASA